MKKIVQGLNTGAENNWLQNKANTKKAKNAVEICLFLTITNSNSCD